jgi:hypothetical protein
MATTVPALGTAVQALSVHLPASGMASAETRVVNWAAGTGAAPDFAFQDLRLGSRIEIPPRRNPPAAQSSPARSPRWRSATATARRSW